MSEGSVTISVAEYMELIKTIGALEEDGVKITTYNYHNSREYGSGNQIEYFTFNDAFIKLAELNKDLNERNSKLQDETINLARDKNNLLGKVKVLEAKHANLPKWVKKKYFK